MRISIAVLAGLIFGTWALACRCGDKPSVERATKTADAVFVGRAIRLSIAHRAFSDRTGDREVIEAEFEVSTALKGPLKVERISVITNVALPGCGFPFRIGEEYLVYAWAFEKEFETDICTRTRPRIVINEGQDFSDLRKLKADDAMETEVPLIRKALMPR